MKIRFVGDIHGKIPEYLNVIDGSEYSIQVGDFGVGFGDFPYDHMTANHLFIRGNHDDPAKCKTIPNWIADGTMVHGKIFCVGGAYSIDKEYRIEGIDWWPEEECTYTELQKIIDIYEGIKPDIVVTHDCPDTISEYVCAYREKKKYDDKSITRHALEVMWQIHKPKIWIYGHWHVDLDIEVEGTRFICLNELSHIDLEI